MKVAFPFEFEQLGQEDSRPSSGRKAEFVGHRKDGNSPSGQEDLHEFSWEVYIGQGKRKGEAQLVRYIYQ